MVSAKRPTVDTRRFHHMTGQLFADQYYHIYNARLLCSRSALIERSRDRWGNEIKNLALEQLNASLGSTEVFVIGTLFKLMPQQPSILKESESNEIASRDPSVNFTSNEDSLVLHETDENVQVVGNIDIHMHVTGIPVSLKGYQLNSGAKFHVLDICYAGLDLSVYKIPPAISSNGHSKKKERIFIVSGLEFGFDYNLKEKEEDIVYSLKKLRSLIRGEGVDYKVVKLIIAGNSIGPGYAKSKTELIGASESGDKRSILEVVDLFDSYLYTLAKIGVDIDVMPGKNDPTSFLLPQQPFHSKILPKSTVFTNVYPTTNPSIQYFRDYLILGTSGENVEAIRQYTHVEDSHAHTALKSTLEWGHIAPSAPDNLSCVPFKDKDPFIIDFVPDIYFAGNQPEYVSTTYSSGSKEKIQLISVPKLVDDLSCVSIDLSNFEVERICLAE